MDDKEQMDLWQNLVVCAYYTPGPYFNEAARLSASIDKFGLASCVGCIGELGMLWEDAVKLKPEYILSCLERFEGRPVVYVDVDAVFIKDPREFLPNTWRGGKKPGMSIHLYRGTEPCSGTVIYHPYSNAQEIVSSWILEQEERPTPHRPQRILNYVKGVNKGLDPEWCWIFDTSIRRYPMKVNQQIIEHLQASREFKAPGRASRALQARKDYLESNYG